jgi:ketosteroid isomerase-like protein
VSSSDEEQVRALVIAYAELLDAGDLDGVAQLFAQGSFRSARGGPPRVGIDAVRKMYDAVVIYDDGTPRTKHVVGNLVVDIDDAASTATASCTFTVIQSVEGAPLQAVLSGRYVDQFARDAGGWHFVERVVHPDLLGDLSLHMGGT